MPEQFTQLTSRTCVLPQSSIDTDQIIPARFLTTTTRTGLGAKAFHDWRHNEAGEPNDHPLNTLDAASHRILVAGDNFACGSSREHAPWALLDFGIRCVIASSYSDIFYSNCFKNGILPVILPQAQIDELLKEAEENPGAPMEVDLEKQVVTRGNKFSFGFEIDPFRKHCLMNGLDEIGLTMEKEAHIASFEKDVKSKRPWI